MKSIFKTLTAAAAVTEMIGGGTAIADDNTDNVLVRSDVQAECNLNAVGTDPNLTVARDQVVADVTIECNHYGDVSVDVTSRNDTFALRHNSEDPNLEIPYSVDWEFNPVTTVAEFFDELIGTQELNNMAGPFTVNFDNRTGGLLEPVNVEI